MMSVFPRIPQTGLSRKERQNRKEAVFEQQKEAELMVSLLWTTAEIPLCILHKTFSALLSGVCVPPGEHAERRDIEGSHQHGERHPWSLALDHLLSGLRRRVMKRRVISRIIA